MLILSIVAMALLLRFPSFASVINKIYRVGAGRKGTALIALSAGLALCGLITAGVLGRA